MYPTVKSPVGVSFVLALSFLGHAALAGTSTPASVISDAADAGKSSSSQRTPGAPAAFTIPGPQRSFLRMAGISQKITPEQLLPLLSRNVITEGYQDTRPTEFLVLLRRYVVQARELVELAAKTGMVIRVTNCDDARPLIEILGYRINGNCGDRQLSLQTIDPQRAFLAIDSGFPLSELEQTLQGGKPFEYPYSSAPVPVLFSESDWTRASVKNNKEDSRDLLDTILNDAAVARLYWAFSWLDSDTRQYMHDSIGLAKLLPYAAVLDFYGREICIRDGRVQVPGGPSADEAWNDLVGARPTSPDNFVFKLLSKDKGWLAAYFDVLSRTNGPQLAYLTDRERLKRFYSGLRAVDTSERATRGAFRPAPGMLLLTTRLQLDSKGEPIVPGGLDAWKDILFHGRDSSLVRKWGKHPKELNSPEQLLQILFALSRAQTDSGPLQIYMTLSELDSRRPADHRLQPDTVRLLARNFEQFSDQYRIYSEFPELGDDSIALFLKLAQGLNGLPNWVRGNGFGMFQANVGIWQILARQGQIQNAQLNESWQQVIKPFASIKNSPQVFDAGRASLAAVFKFSTGKTKGSQDEIIDLLAGPRQDSPEAAQIHREMVARIRSVLDDQRLVSLDTLQIVGDALTEKEHGKQPEEYVILLAGQTREFEMPRPIFSNGEREEWASGVYNNHHTDLQMRSDLPKVLKSPSLSHAQAEDARGQLASFLRDTLVGLNYAYYEPPGAQALHNNPLFVRSHDFAGETITGIETLWQAPRLIGQGSPAGGGAHLVGSLADLPFTLAVLEQDFLAPDNVQALIWEEMTPQLLTSAIVPRWWKVSPLELHAIALYQRMGEDLITESAKDESLRKQILPILASRTIPHRMKQIEELLNSDHPAEVVAQVMPADTFYLAAEFSREHPEQPAAVGTATQELRELIRQHPELTAWNRLSHDFGTPHPSMAQNYGLELLNVAPMPAFSGYSSRFLAETLDSPNLYWARLADEGGYAPVMLNHLVPELTRRMIEKIFATDFEDWPAILKAMQETGTEFREGKLNNPAKISAVQH